MNRLLPTSWRLDPSGLLPADAGAFRGSALAWGSGTGGVLPRGRHLRRTTLLTGGMRSPGFELTGQGLQ